MDYVIVTQAPGYRLSQTAFATESAFAEHLRELRKAGRGHFTRLILVAPELDPAQYEEQKHHLAVLDLDIDQIGFLPAYPALASTRDFWLRHASGFVRRLREALPLAALVHTDMSTDIRRPMNLLAAFTARRLRRPVIFVVDIDYRMHAERLRRLGRGGWKRYLANRFFQQPFKGLQIWLAVRNYQLVLLKSASLVKDFGRGRPHVQNFYDTVHSEQQLMPADQMQDRLAWLRDPNRPLQLCYFGRLVESKGIDRMIDALRLARERGSDARLMIIGDGADHPGLVARVQDAQLGDHVDFRSQVPYGAPLFDLLGQCHLALAAPLIEDTPRSAFDAMARAVPILAFDISYFQDLADASGAVALAAWPDAQALADQIVRLDRDRDQLAAMASNGLAFAAKNTQQSWLQRRMEWTLRFALGAS